jgi:FKBP-type peptidyl-prolyl cis-trans isomerase FklB
MKKLAIISALILGSLSTQVMADMSPPAVLTTPPTTLTQPPGMPNQAVQQPGSSTYTSDIDKLSYSVGVELGQGLKMRGMNINLDIMIQGLRDGYGAKQLQMNQQSIRDTLVNYQKKMAAQMSQKFNAEKDVNLKAGNDFLAKNKDKSGIVTTPSGLQYQIVTAGNGTQPTDKDVIVVNYAGTTIDGHEFDSSYKRGEPMTVQLKYMIPGWIEALKLMKKGAVWNLYIPAKLAYGERGAPPVIGPNQALVFKVELLDVKKT